LNSLPASAATTDVGGRAAHVQPNAAVRQRIQTNTLSLTFIDVRGSAAPRSKRRRPRWTRTNPVGRYEVNDQHVQPAARVNGQGAIAEHRGGRLLAHATNK
jgi:hypothetical protein